MPRPTTVGSTAQQLDSIPCIHTLLLNVVSLRCIRNPTSPKRHCENVRSLTISSNISTQSSIESTMMAAVCDVTQKLDAQTTCNTRNLLLDLKTADTRTQSPVPSCTLALVTCRVPFRRSLVKTRSIRLKMPRNKSTSRANPLPHCLEKPQTPQPPRTYAFIQLATIPAKQPTNQMEARSLQLLSQTQCDVFNMCVNNFHPREN